MQQLLSQSLVTWRFGLNDNVSHIPHNAAADAGTGGNYPQSAQPLAATFACQQHVHIDLCQMGGYLNDRQPFRASLR